MLNAQQPFGADVITRISATMLDPDALERLQQHAHETLAAAHRRGVRGGGRRPEHGLRDRRRRQRDDDPARASHRPATALDGAVHDHGAHAARGEGRRLRRRRPSACARRALPGARRVRRAGHRRRHPRHRADARPARAALHRRRHELGDRARLVRAGARLRGACGTRVRGGADPLRDACRRRCDRGREDPRRRGRADRDRRRRAGRALRLGARRRGRRVPRCRHPRPFRPLRARLVGAAPHDRRGERLLPQRRRLPLAARRPRAPVREGVDRDRLEHSLPRSRDRAGGDLPGAARRLVRLVPDARERREDRARTASAAAADRRRGQRRRRGGEDRGALGDGARRRARGPRGGASTSSSPAARTSTTCSSTSWRSPRERGGKGRNQVATQSQPGCRS